MSKLHYVETQCIGLEKLFKLLFCRPTDHMLAYFWPEKHKFKLKWPYLISGHFRSFFEGAHQFWASVAKGVAGQEAEGGGWSGRWQKLVKVSRVAS